MAEIETDAPSFGSVTNIAEHLRAHHSDVPVIKGFRGMDANYAAHRNAHKTNLDNAGGKPAHTHKREPLMGRTPVRRRPQA